MSDSDYWESAYESGEYKHWEFSSPLPNLLPLQPPTYLGEMREYSTLDREAEPTLSSWLNADSES